MGENNYNLLIKKLDEFIRKYYINQIIKGSILFLSSVFILFVTIVALEYFGEFNSLMRTVLFYSFTLINFIVFLFLIVIPLLRIVSIGNRISHTKASVIIGKHFAEINDKLSNILQLKNLSDTSSTSLITASINQKIEQLKPVPFGLAINFKENTKYLKYLFVPLFIITILAAFEPKIITDSTNRIVLHSEEFIPQAPYSISIQENELRTYKNEDFTITAILNGEELPSSLNILFSEQRYLMSKKEKNKFAYSFRNLQEDITFVLFDGEFSSKSFTIKVLPKPLLENLSIVLDFPDYTKEATLKIDNSGDLVIPEGTVVKWELETTDTENVLLITEDSSYKLKQTAVNQFLLSKQFFKSTSYGISTANAFLTYNDTVFYSLQVTPDLRPSIEIDTQQDSLNNDLFYFQGIIKDDYGFSKLVFHSQFIGSNDSLGETKSELISFNKLLSQTDFFYAWNASSFNLKAGEQVHYYFEVWDNDAINGSKSAKTQTYHYKAPNNSELQKKEEQTNQLVKEELTKNIELTKEIKKELEAFKEKLLDKKQLGFQEKKQLESLLEKQKKVQQSVEKLNKENKKNNELQQRFSNQDENLLEKQKQLEDLFEKVMSEEMKEMMRQMEELMENLKKEELQESLENMELNNEELEKELDRNLELFKQLELEKKLNDAKQKLDEIKKEQEQIKEKGQEKQADSEDLKQEQEKLNEKFDDLREKLDEIEKKNAELESPHEMENTNDLEESIKEDMKESANELSEKNKKKAGEKQESAENKMEQLSEKLDAMQSQMQSQANAENLEDLRAILENLIQLSFDQEKVMEELKLTDRNDPRYVQLTQEQQKLMDDSKIIEDSLFALSKRVIQLESIINKEITAVNFNMKKAIEELGERKTPVANSRQQLSMTSINNLALLLDEAIQNMQMQMQLQQGKGQCEKPGGGKPSPGGMKKMQQQLNKQLEDLKKAMENGQKPGGQEGNSPGNSGKGGMSKELAQMAAKQAAIRKAIEELQQQIGESNGDGGGNLKKLGELMEQTETDIVNKQITNQTLLRQKEILSRLLESEKAEREREKDEKREAIEFTDELSRNPNIFLEYNRQKQKEIELLRTLPPSFNGFYRMKVTEYFNQLEK